MKLALYEYCVQHGGVRRAVQPDPGAARHPRLQLHKDAIHTKQVRDHVN